MKHLRLATRKPVVANVDLNGLFASKVEAKENVINAKAGAFR